MLLAVNLYENFIDEESITIPSVLSLQSSSVYGSEFDAPEPDGFVAYSDTTLSEKIFNEWSGTPAVAEIEAVIQPNGVTDDIRWKPVTLVCINRPILAIWAS